MSNLNETKQFIRFGDCTLEKLDDTFNLKPVDELEALHRWLGWTVDLTPFERTSLEFYQAVLRQNKHDWNEMELLQGFIGPVFTLVNFTTKKFNLFADRLIMGVVDGIELKGEPDGLIASGFRSPKKPFFCLQEYKKLKNPDGDPAGQCLAAMLVAQVLNETKYPVYGCYVIGHDWYFMVLQGREYAISHAYVATRNDIFDIFRILKALKQIITDIVAENN